MMRPSFPRSARSVGLLAFCVLAGPGLRAADSLLSVTFGDQHKDISAADLAQLAAAETDVVDHGKPHHYRGVAAHDVLALVGIPLGEKYRGTALALVVRVRAADGYVVLFSLAEFDPAFREQTILLADHMDGAPLPENAGPLRLVCPGDKRPARSIRQVVSLEVISLSTGERKRIALPKSQP